ncbi:disintegrin and metalloproteinase domain-containing protein 23-like [Carassius auratus]|uniref:Disintegrin and metalloproteinase domain-containing protein 23-like n=1 Tax=Carassius auratus TaxID=7957 RepID=A0A6P6KUD0_CARAU|nr:disintegrin and metalloproteinase domain-containing protein 23-like [Carassius auratus]
MKCVCVLSVLEPEIPEETVSLLLQKDNDAAGQKHNASGPQQTKHTLTYPSHLIYFLNKASESIYHDLNPRRKIPDPHGQKVYLAQASLQLQAFGSQFILDLTFNNLPTACSRVSQRNLLRLHL